MITISIIAGLSPIVNIVVAMGVGLDGEQRWITRSTGRDSFPTIHRFRRLNRGPWRRLDFSDVVVVGGGFVIVIDVVGGVVSILSVILLLNRRNGTLLCTTDSE